MTIGNRDKKILLVIVPLALLAAFWFLVLTPKRQEAAQAGDKLAKQEKRLQDARSKLAGLESSRNAFGSDFTELVRLGKAVPTQMDMPSVVVQLESAARGTGIGFTKIGMGERQASGGSSAGGGSAESGGSSGEGGSAQSEPGKAAETAEGGADKANQATEGEASGSESGKGSSGAPGGAGGSGVAGLDAVPLELEFQGNFLKLADFFHRLKRFVSVAEQKVRVHGRLMTVEGLKFSSDPDLFPRVKAELKATVYLAPATEGATAGASPQGPPSATPTGGGDAAPSGQSPNPAATATR